MEILVFILVLATLVGISQYVLRDRDTDSNASLKIEAEPVGIQRSGVATSTRLTEVPERFVVLDLETTGLSPTADEIIEIGAIRVNRDQINHTAFSTLVKPARNVPKKITNITGITQRMVDDDGVPLAEAMSQFIEFIGDLPLVTFNAEFDMGFLQNATKSLGLPLSNRYACALQLARRAWPGLPSYRLAALAEMGNLPTEDSHRALGDCQRALIVFTAAVSQMGKKIGWSTLPN